MKELLTGKNRENFEKWLYKYIRDNVAWENEYPEQEDIDMFYKYPFEMQLGVLLSYYKSHKIYILVQPFETPNDWVFTILGEDIMSPFFVIEEYNTENPKESFDEAYKTAFIKANEILNEK